MTKIYEALENAGHERLNLKEQNSQKSYIEAYRNYNNKIEKTMTSIYNGILSSLPDSKCRVVQFVDMNIEEPCSKIIRELAKVVSIKMNKRVLLLDANPLLTDHKNYFNIANKWDIDKNFDDIDLIKNKLVPIGQYPLYVAQMSLDSSMLNARVNSKQCNLLFEELKNIFDLILIDYPSMGDDLNNLLISSRIDGVVLVVEAEKTKWQIVEKIKEKIIVQGGDIVGVILNKRKFYIPDFIYKRI